MDSLKNKLSEKQYKILSEKISDEYIEKLETCERASDFINLIIQLKHKNSWKEFITVEKQLPNDLEQFCEGFKSLTGSDSPIKFHNCLEVLGTNIVYYIVSQKVDNKMKYYWVTPHLKIGNLYEDLIDLRVYSVHDFIMYIRNLITIYSK